MSNIESRFIVELMPTQITLKLENDFANEIKNAKEVFKSRFIKINKSYLEEKNYSVQVDGFIIDEQLYDGQIKFQIRLVNSDNEDVTFKELSNLK
jgi:ribosomal protein S8